MYLNVATKKTRIDKEFLTQEFKDLVYEASIDNCSFDRWLDENYSASDIFYAEAAQEERIMNQWANYCEKSVAADLLNSATDSYYLKHTDGWKYVGGDK